MSTNRNWVLGIASSSLSQALAFLLSPRPTPPLSPPVSYLVLDGHPAPIFCSDASDVFHRETHPMLKYRPSYLPMKLCPQIIPLPLTRNTTPTTIRSFSDNHQSPFNCHPEHNPLGYLLMPHSCVAPPRPCTTCPQESKPPPRPPKPIQTHQNTMSSTTGPTRQ